ncbi:MAG: hypothetical protein WCD44_01005 [Candidatus Babeliales bacterium]|jgi:recombinational DNA repair protein (RecF pathway)
MEDYIGIILKRDKTKNKVAVLDKQLGRIEGITRAEVTIGAFVQYTMQPAGSGFFLNQIQTTYMPLFLAQEDLLFLHHIFELSYYFVPIGSCVRGVFELFEFLYRTEKQWKNRLLQIIFLFKLLTTLGVYAEYDTICKKCFSYLIVTPIDNLNSGIIDLNCKKALPKWLQYCVIQYPVSKEFKTMHFLNENNYDE